MSASFLPQVLVPLIGLVLPLVFLTSFFRFIQKESIN